VSGRGKPEVALPVKKREKHPRNLLLKTQGWNGSVPFCHRPLCFLVRNTQKVTVHDLGNNTYFLTREEKAFYKEIIDG
jgi:hypothetical protein